MEAEVETITNDWPEAWCLPMPYIEIMEEGVEHEKPPMQENHERESNKSDAILSPPDPSHREKMKVDKYTNTFSVDEEDL